MLNMKSKAGRTLGIQDPPIQKIIAEANVPKDAIDLGQGVPFYGPPEEAVLAASEALNKEIGFKYSPDPGTRSLREAIRSKLATDNGIEADADKNIMVTAGANQAFVNAVLSITELADRVIVLAPYYFNHVMAIQLAGCKPAIVETDGDYQPLVHRIADKLTKRTRAVVLVSPNNPTGAVYEKKKIKEISKLCADRSMYLITDDTYEHFVYDGAEYASALGFDRRIEHTISLYSFSKSYGMAGYRIGYAVLPEHLYSEMLKVQDTLTICPPSALQFAAEAAIKLGAAYPKRFIPAIEKVRKIFRESLPSLRRAEIPVTKGSYYFMLRLKTKRRDWVVARKLIEEYGVITIPGEAFGTTRPALRVAYANVDEQKAEEGISRLTRGLEKTL